VNEELREENLASTTRDKPHRRILSKQALVVTLNEFQEARDHEGLPTAKAIIALSSRLAVLIDRLNRTMSRHRNLFVQWIGLRLFRVQEIDSRVVDLTAANQSNLQDLEDPKPGEVTLEKLGVPPLLSNLSQMTPCPSGRLSERKIERAD